MKRAALYSFIQNCLMNQEDYVTEIGLITYPSNLGKTVVPILIFDALIDRYLLYPYKPLQIPLLHLIELTGRREEEIIHTLVALTSIKFGSHNEEHSLLKVKGIEIDNKNEVMLTFELDSWLAYHLSRVSTDASDIVSFVSKQNERMEVKM